MDADSSCASKRKTPKVIRPKLERRAFVVGDPPQRIIPKEMASALLRTARKRLGFARQDIDQLIADGLVVRWGRPSHQLVIEASVVKVMNSLIADGRGKANPGLPFGKQRWPPHQRHRNDEPSLRPRLGKQVASIDRRSDHG